MDRYIQQLEKAFKKLPKPLEWRSFYRNDLNLLVETPQKIRDIAVQQELSKSQIRALGKLNAVPGGRFGSFIEETSPSRGNEKRPARLSPGKRSLEDYSAAEIQAVAEKEIKKRSQAHYRKEAYYRTKDAASVH